VFTVKPWHRTARIAVALAATGALAVTAGVAPADAAQQRAASEPHAASAAVAAAAPARPTLVISKGSTTREAVTVDGATLTVIPNASGEPGYALRDRCGGANGTVSFNGAGISTWGEVWSIDTGSCQGGGTHWVYLTWDANVLPGAFDWTSAKAAPGATAGFNMPTKNAGGTIDYIEAFLCSSAYENGGCNDQAILYNSL
jgi:hypothetical protein